MVPASMAKVTVCLPPENLAVEPRLLLLKVGGNPNKTINCSVRREEVPHLLAEQFPYQEKCAHMALYSGNFAADQELDLETIREGNDDEIDDGKNETKHADEAEEKRKATGLGADEVLHDEQEMVEKQGDMAEEPVQEMEGSLEQDHHIVLDVNAGVDGHAETEAHLGLETKAKPHSHTEEEGDEVAQQHDNLEAKEEVANVVKAQNEANIDPPASSPANGEPRPILPEQTLIIFDWDDTLCPTSLCIEELGVDLQQAAEGRMKADLDILAHNAQLALEEAQLVSKHVAIVTNAGEGWVQNSCQGWMPSLRETLSDVEVVSARSRWEPLGVSCPFGWKQREFERIINTTFADQDNDNDNASLKNVIVVGDAEYEHDALKFVTKLAAPEITAQFRTKSIRFLQKPTVKQLCYQTKSLYEILYLVVAHNGDLDVQIPLDVMHQVEEDEVSVIEAVE
mmetsp:Transcript_15133/g.32632  ORF Transcript_15133/g.32632 Transcript_15133/m.32632 type:complete len:454 (-) Transcript_15133:462-1823(-)